jgi:multidrug efflux pump subunit AcrB
MEGRERSRRLDVLMFLVISLLALALVYKNIGQEIFPKVNAAQAQVRLRMPTGTRIERTESATQKLLAIADSITHFNVEISSAFVGTQPSSYPINNVYLWTSGPQESVIKINLKKNAGIAIEDFKEQMRAAVSRLIPEARLSFEPGDLVDQVLNLGTNNPIELAVTGRNFSQTRKVAEQLSARLSTINYLRDVQVATPLDYPGVQFNIDRVKAGQEGLTVDQVSKSVVAATSSSRFTQPNYWLDKNTGTAYQVQVEYPQYMMNSPDQLGVVPIVGTSGNGIYLRDIASIRKTFTPGEFDRINQQRFITVTANIHGGDLGTAIRDVNGILSSLGTLPPGVKILVRGQSELLKDTTSELQSGLLIAIVVIILMMAVFFQSIRLSFVVLSTIPAVLTGSLLLLWLTGKSLNIQSYMGIIMAVGVAVANAILYVTNAEILRKRDWQSGFAALAASNRFRPILMTSLAMIAGMIPVAIGLGEGGEQTAPLGIAVIGGLTLSMMGTLGFLPLVYAWANGKRPYQDPSLDPEDPRSRSYEPDNKAF